MIAIKYKPTYIVSVSDKRIGYVDNKEEFEENIKSEIIEYTGNNIDSISLKEEPTYEFKLVDRQEETNEEEVIIALQKDATITYKYYEIALNGEKKTCVNSEEEANQVISEIKEKYSKEDIKLDFKVNEVKTENMDNVKTESLEVAETNLVPQIDKMVKYEHSVPKVNGIKLAVQPVSGTISSRYGASSRIRVSTHTGLDIACSSGTSIKAVADGKVTSTNYDGAYGNLVKINHGNGVETWYAHCSKVYTTVGKTVKAGDVIAAVGTTGNSTGPHLHLEIRINGQHVNPQKYLYK